VFFLHLISSQIKIILALLLNVIPEIIKLCLALTANGNKLYKQMLLFKVNYLKNQKANINVVKLTDLPPSNLFPIGGRPSPSQFGEGFREG
jgi:hypothetical protein